MPADAIKSLMSADGNVLLFNCHISSDRTNPIRFPDTDAALPDEYARLLFAMSSVLPTHIRDVAQQQGYSVTDGTRGFVFNADIAPMWCNSWTSVLGRANSVSGGNSRREVGSLSG